MQRRLTLAFAVSLFLFQLQPGLGQAARPAPDKFRYERAIIPGGTGPNRLLIDTVLLAGGNSLWQFYNERAGSERVPMTIATGGLADLRIYDSLNRELPYLMILPPSPEPSWLNGHLSPVAPTKKTSGFQVDLGRSLLMDRLRLAGLTAPFVKRCILEASNDAYHWDRLRDDATIFDLPAEKLTLMEIEFEQGEYRYLKVTWDDSASARISLPRSASARLLSAGSLPPRLGTPLQFERRGSEPGVSRYRLRLPGPRLPITEIRLSANGEHILRQARITEGRLSGGEIVPNVLGTATLRREVRGELYAAEMSILIAPPQEAILDLTIDDENNPPLEITGISAFFAYLPWIYFESVDGKPLTAHFGYPDLNPPHYDLEAARVSAAKAKTAEAHWGKDLRSKASAESPGDNGVPGVGSVIDLGGFRYARGISGGKPGLSALPLDAASLAHSRMADLRIAASDGHQIPYLLERADEPLSLELPALEKTVAPRPDASGRRSGTGSLSYYRLRLPYQGLPPARLVFTTSARVFQRNLYILIERNPLDVRQESWTKSIAQALWSHGDPETPAPALVLNIPTLKTAEALVVVEEGDNSPLPITSARLLLPAYRMRFFRESKSNLKLYYGREELGAPRYDLAILAPRLMGAAAEELSMDPEGVASAQTAKPLSVKLFWGILIAAVFVLLTLIARLVKKS